MFGFNLRGGNKRGSGFGWNTVFHKPSQQAADNTKDAEEKAKIEKQKAAKKAAEEEAARVAAEQEAARAEEVEEELEKVD